MSLKEYIFSRGEKRPVFMPYLTLGDPSFEDSVRFALAMADAGADVLELGIPFSDPTADGPVIQAAMVRSMARSDFSMERVFQAAEEIHAARPELPLVFLTYFNPVANTFAGPGAARQDASYLRESLERFFAKCEGAGVRGLVIPDLPFDEPESHLIRELGAVHGVDQILMVAPTTEERRRKKICKTASGFIYYVTSLGVTGEKKEFPADMKDKIRQVRKESGVPVLAGFGFSRPEQVEGLAGVVDGVIVGSENHRIIEGKGAAALQDLVQLTAGFVDALTRDAGLLHGRHPA